MEIDRKHIESLIATLRFYGGGENFKWDGCSCHGHYTQVEHGEKAENCIEKLKELFPKCKKCNYDLSLDDQCDNEFCDNFYIPLEEQG